jgi:hypothetical protein
VSDIGYLQPTGDITAARLMIRSRTRVVQRPRRRLVSAAAMANAARGIFVTHFVTRLVRASVLARSIRQVRL